MFSLYPPTLPAAVAAREQRLVSAPREGRRKPGRGGVVLRG